jgi:hypothetical protein
LARTTPNYISPGFSTSYRSMLKETASEAAIVPYEVTMIQILI